jgi:hypothetical protein
MKTELQYRTFDDLMNSVRSDLYTFDQDNFLNPQELLKIAIKVNYELGLKINPSRGKIIEVHNGKGKLPADFYVMNFGMLCGVANETYSNCTQSQVETMYDQMVKLAEIVNARPLIQVADLGLGWNIVTHNLGSTNVVLKVQNSEKDYVNFEYVILNENQVKVKVFEVWNAARITIIAAANVVANCSISLDNCPDGCKIVENRPGLIREFPRPVPIEIIPYNYGEPECNLANVGSYNYRMKIKDGFIHTINFKEGRVYINYESLMEDDEGNLLVLDHPLVNEYYEYALKERILENLFMNGEPLAAQKLQLIQSKMMIARTNALSFINTPDYGEMKRMWEKNRKAMYAKYYNMFNSYAWYGGLKTARGPYPSYPFHY